jgi:HPt (histidine-containing phosphotransfer) domain-containing protein
VAHSIKAAAHSLAAKELADIAFELEKSAHRKDAEKLMPLIPALEENIQLVLEDLKAYVAECEKEDNPVEI